MNYRPISQTICLLCSLFVFQYTLVQAQPRFTGKPFATRSEVIAQQGMAATSHPLATQAAIDILKKEGTAMDAAIAANAVLGVVEPTGNGIGGDIFAIVWDAKTQKLYGFNGSGRSPYNLTLDVFNQLGLKGIPSSGALAVSVPGCVDGWYALNGRFGKLPMKELLQPAIHYAKAGYPVTEVIAAAWRGYARSLQRFENFKKTYMPNGRTPEKGEIFRNPDLAATLTKIAEGGRDAFYKGEIAKIIATTVQREGGYISEKDLADHHSDWVDPVSTNYRGYDIWELPPNGQGMTTLQMLNILEGYDIKAMGFGSAEYLHHLIEAKKLAYEDRAVYYADPDFADIPVEGLLSKEYAAERRALIDPDRASREYKPGMPEGKNTIYLTVADKEGNMVSLIQSNYSGMGGGIVPDGLGFSLQNRGTSFNLEEGHFNTYAPHKRPFHTIIPGFITKEGKPYMSFGVMGGDFQPQGHVQVLINMIDFGMNIQEAGDAPRVSHSGSSGPDGGIMDNGGSVSLEGGFTQEAILGLARKGHRINLSTGGHGGYQAIRYDAEHQVYYGASESRKDGQAAGY
ncbi:gamma-glutamyltransferase [Parapedobacter koreensis]|uniref:Glutathione hydrolase proenzyme n=1 Tax=Parapedobacter koreensis TaxID=332977 RepID=A0A1H7FMQ7_9SPHI|nr:gamma-glutamyltransferase [Parapedobacter koreensis]SEK27376.1 gamma-glutamyltranspeptidase / glutathione hydrolase [Parapedobacter koreensis]